MKFSVCIPNYNYAQYIDSAIQSVLTQDHDDFEILVTDNASTDASVAVVQKVGDPRVRLQQNRWNVGFAQNVDRATRNAVGELMMLLASDDLMLPGAMSKYVALFEAIGGEQSRALAGARQFLIDGDGKHTGDVDCDDDLWRGATDVPELQQRLGFPVQRIDATTLLHRCLERQRTPLSAATTVYPRKLYEEIEGYAANRTYGPDKWYAWKLLTVADDVYFIGEHLAAQRWHPENQFYQERNEGALKYLVDSYLNTLEIAPQTLRKANMSAENFIEAFVEYQVARHGLATLARGQRTRAARIRDFGRSTYPQAMRKNLKARSLSALLHLGPLGTEVARLTYPVAKTGLFRSAFSSASST